MDIYEKFTEDELEEMHDEMLDEVYPEIKIGNLTFYPSQVLANCDPIAYQISVNEYADFLQEQENEE
ncbi:MAG: hypothetical protein EBR82_71630 [Caulobacteraceae bacterium]|nr:hypothetical protein [Caulobacteraceae bacterium]